MTFICSARGLHAIVWQQVLYVYEYCISRNFALKNLNINVCPVGFESALEPVCSSSMIF